MKIVDTDAFLDMSQTAQLLYFHFSMRADDDGFVSNPKKIMRMIGVQEDDIKVLLSKRFILSFESGVVVIKHWRVHNIIRSDRYTETSYIEEKGLLSLKKDGSYTDSKGVVTDVTPIPKIDRPQWQKEREEVMKQSELPFSFSYKIRRAFIGKPCPVCTSEMREDELSDNRIPTIQHNIPISKGGKHELGNISVICKSCNLSIQDSDTESLNSQEVTIVWGTIGNQSAPQVRLGKDRIGEKREEGELSPDKPENHLSYLKNIPSEDIKEFTDDYKVTEEALIAKASDLLDWCEANGKRKKNYKAFLRVAVKKDFGKRTPQDKVLEERIQRTRESIQAGPSPFAKSLLGKMKM